MTLKEQIIEKAKDKIHNYKIVDEDGAFLALDFTGLTGPELDLDDETRKEIFEEIFDIIIIVNERLKSKDLQAINYIDISDNALVDLPSNLSQLDLCILNANNNKFKKFPDGLVSNENLIGLNFKGNKELVEIPVEISKLKELKILDLTNCNIQLVETTQEDLGVYNLSKIVAIYLEGNDNLPANFIERFQSMYNNKLRISDSMRDKVLDSAYYIADEALDPETIQIYQELNALSLSNIPNLHTFRDITIDELLKRSDSQNPQDLQLFLEPVAQSIQTDNVYAIFTIKDVNDPRLRQIKESRTARYYGSGYQNYELEIDPSEIKDPNSSISKRLNELFQILYNANGKVIIEINHHGLPTNVDPDLMGEVVAEMLYKAGFRGHARVIYGPCNADVGTEAERFTNKLKELGCEQVVVESLNGVRKTILSPKVDPKTGVHSQTGLTLDEYKKLTYKKYIAAKKDKDEVKERENYKAYFEAEITYYQVGEERTIILNKYGDEMEVPVYSHIHGELSYTTFRYISDQNRPIEVIRNKKRSLEVIRTINQKRKEKKQGSQESSTSNLKPSPRQRSQGGRTSLH